MATRPIKAYDLFFSTLSLTFYLAGREVENITWLEGDEEFRLELANGSDGILRGDTLLQIDEYGEAMNVPVFLDVWEKEDRKEVRVTLQIYVEKILSFEDIDHIKSTEGE